MSDTIQLRSWAFISLLIGGILIIVGGLMGAAMMGVVGPMGMAPMSDMMGVSMDDDWLTTMSWWMGGIGLVTGGLVLLASFQVYRGRQTALWSGIAIVAGASSLFAMGGYVLGAIAAIAGGALGLLGQARNEPHPGGA